MLYQVFSEHGKVKDFKISGLNLKLISCWIVNTINRKNYEQLMKAGNVMQYGSWNALLEKAAAVEVGQCYVWSCSIWVYSFFPQALLLLYYEQNRIWVKTLLVMWYFVDTGKFQGYILYCSLRTEKTRIFRHCSSDVVVIFHGIVPSHC